MNARKLLAIAGCAAALCAGVSAQTVLINGAGATFPYPIYSKWFSEYNKLHPNVQINYQSIGSGGGIRQITNQTVFFGATDGPMTNDQLLAAPGKILHFPTVLGAVVPVYNIPGVTAELKFTGPVLADIFLGKITKWNDPEIAKLNPGVKLPVADITVVHRSDGSGTTYIWVDYLAKVSAEWKTKVGVATAVNWPSGVGGKGNEGVAGLVQQTPGSIGYVELIYALQNKISYGSVQNMAGEFVRASVPSVTAAAAAAAGKMPADFRVSITNADRQGRVSDLVLHLAAALREPEGQGAVEDDGRFHEVGADGRPEVLRRARLCAVARAGRQARDGRAREDQDLVAGRRVRSASGECHGRRGGADTSHGRFGIQAGDGRVCARPRPDRLRDRLRTDAAVDAVDREVRPEVLAHSGLGSRRRQFGALPFIWGTLYSSILALALATPIALGIAVFISELCPNLLRQPLVFLTELLAAIPSIVYGLWGIFVLVPFVRALESGMPRLVAQPADLQRPPARRRHAGRWTDSGRDGDSVHVLRGARGAQVGACARSARARTRSARRGGKPSASRSSTRAPASSAPSCSDSAARSARRWP